MGCDIHFYVERKQHVPIEKLAPSAPPKLRGAIVNGLPGDKDQFVRQTCRDNGITDWTPPRVRAELLVKHGLVASQWAIVIPPERDLERWPRTPRDDGYVSPFYGPSECMYERGQCYGYSVEDEHGEWNEVECHGDDTCPRCFGHKRGIDWYHNRNYELFGILAGVRRPDMPMIAPPRGAPADISFAVLSANSWDHTPSWVTVREVLEYDWDRSAEHSGILSVFPEGEGGGFDMESFEEWMKRTNGKSSPTGYCQGRGGRMITIPEAKRMIAGTDPTAAELRKDIVDRRRLVPSDSIPIVRAKWTEKTRSSAPDFLAFVETFIEPLLGDEYAQLKSIIGDALEGENRRSADDDPVALRRDWLTADANGKTPEVKRLRARALEIAQDVRFVFGFDS